MSQVLVMDAPGVLEVIQKEADAAKPNARPIPSAIPGTSGARQGDIYIGCVPVGFPKGKKTKNRQLAPGSNLGSRHIVEGDVEVYATIFHCPDWFQPGRGIERLKNQRERLARELLGPVLVSKKGFTVTHPEHGHIKVPAGTWQVCYQMDPRTEQRVQD